MTSRGLHWACSHFDTDSNPFQLSLVLPAYGIGAGGHCPRPAVSGMGPILNCSSPRTTAQPTNSTTHREASAEDPAPSLPLNFIFHLHSSCKSTFGCRTWLLHCPHGDLSIPPTHMYSVILPTSINLSGHILAFLQDLMNTPSVLTYLYSHLPLG